MLKSRITLPSLGCCLRTLPRIRLKSVLTKRYTIDQRAVTFRNKQTV